MDFERFGISDLLVTKIENIGYIEHDKGIN